MKPDLEYFDRYMRDGFDYIEGWPGLRPSVEFMRNFGEIFSSFSEKGGACEIGIHHAKYLIALHNISPEANSLGLDLFDAQDRNIDLSGRGVLDICRSNIEKFAQNPQLVTLRALDSLELRERQKREILDEFGPFSIFSIDGGHTSLHLVNDFLSASALTSSTGIIVIDDIFHPDWPGVTEGIFRVLQSEISPFVPFMITRKKLFLCFASLQSQYVDFVMSKRMNIYVKLVDFVRWKIPSFNFGAEYG